MTNIATLRLGIDARGARRGAREFEGAAGQVTKAASGVGRVLGGLFAGASLAAGATKAVQIMASFEKGLVGVGKTADLQGDALDALGKEILGLASDIPTATNELLSIAQAAGQLGVTGSENIIAFTDTVAKLGSASDLSGEAAATTLARLLNVTGESVAGVATLGSVIVRLGNEFAATESEIAYVAQRVAQATAAFDVTSAHAVALGAALKSLGIEGEAGSTAVGKAFRAIDAAVRGGSDALLEFAEVAGVGGAEFAAAFQESNIRGFQMFIDGLGRIGAAGGDVAGTLGSLGLEGERAIAVLGTLATQSDILGTALVTAADELEHTTALENEAARGADTLAGDWQRLKNVAGALAVELGEGGVGSALRGIVQTTADVLRVFAGMENKVQGNVETAERLADAIKSVTAGFALMAAIKIGAWLKTAVGGLALAASGTLKLAGAVASGRSVLLGSAEAERQMAAATIAATEAALARTEAEIISAEAVAAHTLVDKHGTAASLARSQADYTRAAAARGATVASIAQTEAELALARSSALTFESFAAERVAEAQLGTMRAGLTAQTAALAETQAALAATVAAATAVETGSAQAGAKLTALNVARTAQTEALTAATAKLAAAQAGASVTAGAAGVAFRGFASVFTGPVGMVVGLSAAAYGLFKLIEATRSVGPVSRAAALGIDSAVDSTGKYIDALGDARAAVDQFTRAQAELNLAISRGDAAAGIAAINSKIRILDDASVSIQERIDEVGGSFAEISKLKVLIPTLDVGPLREDIIGQLSESIESALADNDYSRIFRDPLLQQLGDMDGDAYAFAQRINRILTGIRVGKLGGFEEFSSLREEAEVTAERIVDAFGFEGLPAQQALELLEQATESLRIEADQLRSTDPGSDDRAAGYEREAKSASLLTRAMEWLGGAFETALELRRKTIDEGNATLDEYLLRLQEETMLTAATAEDREILTAVMRAERIARQHNIELSADYVDALETEIRTQQMLREEKEKALKAEKRLKESLVIPEPMDPISLAPKLGDIEALRDMVAELEFEHSILGLTNEERERAILLRNFDAQAAGLEGDEVARLRERLLAAHDAIQKTMNQKALGDAIGEGFARGVEDALMHLDNLKGVAQAVLQDIQRAFIRAFVVESGIKSLMSNFAQGLMFGGGGGAAGALHGAVVGLDHGGVIGLAGGGITDIPTAVGMVGDRVAISSEFGQREAVMPLKRGSGGDLGVKVEMPDQGPHRTVNITNQFPNVTSYDEFQAAERHMAADARRKLGRFN
ncbi:MAG: phage tail tape measure protein [bacterium]|nr:phage tail tape measure protein [bacterium]